MNLPEVVKGALFARYSRSSKSLRRLFLDEFVGDLDLTGDLDRRRDHRAAARGGALRARLRRVRRRLRRAARRRAPRVRAVVEPADEDPRVGSAHGVPRAVDALHPVRHPPRRSLPVPPTAGGAAIAARRALRRGHGRAVRDVQGRCCPRLMDWARARYPKDPADSDFVYKQTIKAKACDAARGMLPAATLSNVGIYGTGQAFEALLLRMRSHPLPEARAYAGADARPSSARSSRRSSPASTARTGAWRGARTSRRPGPRPRTSSHGCSPTRSSPGPAVVAHRLRPRRRGQGARGDLLSAHRSAPTTSCCRGCARLGTDERVALLRAYVGERHNRRHRPGRAFERTDYRFDVLADYGAFRDLQRHRMFTIEWQRLTPAHGYEVPGGDRRGRPRRRRSRRRWRASAALHDALAESFPEQAAYAVALAYRIRFAMQMNAREAMHLLELRTSPQGHPAYRRVGQEMHRLIAEQAGHRAIAEAMRYVDHDDVRARAPRVRAGRSEAPPARAATPERENLATALTCGDARRCRSGHPTRLLTDGAASGVLLTHPCGRSPVVGVRYCRANRKGSKASGPRRPSRERWNNPPAGQAGPNSGPNGLLGSVTPGAAARTCGRTAGNAATARGVTRHPENAGVILRGPATRRDTVRRRRARSHAGAEMSDEDFEEEPELEDEDIDEEDLADDDLPTTTSTTMTTSRWSTTLEIDIDAELEPEIPVADGRRRPSRRPRPRGARTTTTTSSTSTRSSTPTTSRRRSTRSSRSARPAPRSRTTRRSSRRKSPTPTTGARVRPGSSRAAPGSSSARRASWSCPGTSSPTRSGCSAATAPDGRRRRRVAGRTPGPTTVPAVARSGPRGPGSGRCLPRGRPVARPRRSRPSTSGCSRSSPSSRCCGRGAARRRGGRRSTASCSGSAFFGTAARWSRYFGAVAIAPLVIAEAAYLAGGRRARRGSSTRRGMRSPWLVAAVWVVVEAVRGRCPLGGLPWGELGVALHDSTWARALASVRRRRARLVPGRLLRRVAPRRLLALGRGPGRTGDSAERAARAAHGRARAGRHRRRRGARPTRSATSRPTTGHDQVRAAAGQRPEPQPDPAGDRRRLPRPTSTSRSPTRSTGNYDLIVFPESSLERDPTTDPELRDAARRRRARSTARSCSRTPGSRRPTAASTTRTSRTARTGSSRACTRSSTSSRSASTCRGATSSASSASSSRSRTTTRRATRPACSTPAATRSAR